MSSDNVSPAEPARFCFRWIRRAALSLARGVMFDAEATQGDLKTFDIQGARHYKIRRAIGREKSWVQPPLWADKNEPRGPDDAAAIAWQSEDLERTVGGSRCPYRVPSGLRFIQPLSGLQRTLGQPTQRDRLFGRWHLAESVQIRVDRLKVGGIPHRPMIAARSLRLNPTGRRALNRRARPFLNHWNYRVKLDGQ